MDYGSRVHFFQSKNKKGGGDLSKSITPVHSPATAQSPATAPSPATPPAAVFQVWLTFLTVSLRPGDWVVAMGCPLSLQNTITAGIVSCVDRKSSDLGLGGMRREYLQTDCAINAGNSGGPLVNIDGEVIGVNIMKVLAADGLSFSVPIDSVSRIIEHFKTKGRVVRPWLGLKMLDLNDMIVAQLKEKDVMFPDVSKGVLVPMVSPGSPAERAGFRPGDVVVVFDGKPVGSIKEVIEIMGDKVGKPINVVVNRANNTSATLTVIPEEANPDM